MTKLLKFDQSSIAKIFEADFDVEIDGDGDIYVSGYDMPVAVWIKHFDEVNTLRISTFTKFKEEVNINSALEFVNEANKSILYAGYSISADSNERLLLWGFNFLDTTYGLDGNFIIASAKKFSSSFVYAVRQDTDDIFFD